MDINYIYTFMFVLIRLSIILYLAVFFDRKQFPMYMKISFAFFLAVIITPNIKIDYKNCNLLIIFLEEVLKGLEIGFSLKVFTFIFQIAGNIFDTSIGLNMAQLYDPESSSSEGIFTKFFLTTALLFFVLNDMHLRIIEILIKSFQTIPICGFYLNTGIIKTIYNSFLYGAVISMPLVCIMLTVDLVLGIATKTIPQVNIFSVGFIIKIFLGLFMLYFYMFIFNNITMKICNLIF